MGAENAGVKQNSGRLTYVFDGIYGPALMPNLKMQIRAGCTTGSAYQRDYLTGLDLVPRRHQVSLIVSVSGDIAISVTNLDHVAVSLSRAGISHNTGRNRNYIGAGLAREIHASMAGRLSCKRI